MSTARSATVSNPVDTTVVLQIGGLRLSAYALEKNAVAALGPEFLNPSAKNEDVRAEWFKGYLRRQIVVADACRLGYDERPEVIADVDKMAGYIMASPAGPYYAYLCRGFRPSDDELKLLRERQRRILDAVFIQFPSRNLADACLGPDFLQHPLAERLSRVESHALDSGVHYFNGHISWPYDAFAKYSNEIESLHPGEWKTLEPSDQTVLYMFIRGTSLRPEAAESDQQLRESVTQFRDSQFEQMHRASVAESAHLVINASAYADVIKAMKLRPKQDADISPRLLTNVIGDVLLSYTGPIGERNWTVGEFLNEYNGRPLRVLSGVEHELSEACIDMPLFDWDTYNARKMNLNSTPRFMEDRLNYLRTRALMLYDVERLMPRRPITEQDIQNYYRETRDTRIVSTKCRGELIEFDSASSAIQFDPQHTAGTALRIIQVVENQDGLVGNCWSSDEVLNSKRDRVFGPCRLGNKFETLIRCETIESRPETLEECRRVIKQRLENLRILDLEAEAERRLGKSFIIIDHIDYKKYGLPPSVAPWNS